MTQSTPLTIGQLFANDVKVIARQKEKYPDLSNPKVYDEHVLYWLHIANDIVLAPQNRRYVVDDNNSKVLRFLLLYFNQSPLAEDVFPERKYKLHKNILLQGGVGVGFCISLYIFLSPIYLIDFSFLT